MVGVAFICCAFVAKIKCHSSYTTDTDVVYVISLQVDRLIDNLLFLQMWRYIQSYSFTKITKE